MTSDPNAIVEIEYGETIDDLTIVRVYDETKSYYKLGSVSYFKATGASMSMYDEYEIQDVMVSSEPEPVNRKENMIDDDFSTRWTSYLYHEVVGI